MATVLSVFETFAGHNAKTTSIAPQNTRSIPILAVPITDATGLSNALPQPIVRFSAWTEGSSGGLGANFSGAVSNTGGTPLWGICTGVNVEWSVDGALTDNGGGRCLIKDSVASAGRNAPSLILAFSGAAQTAFQNGANTLTAVSGVYTAAYAGLTPYQGLAHFCEFENDPPDGFSDATEVITRLTRALSWRPESFVLGTTSAGALITMKDCNFAAVGPDCTAYVDPVDFPGADNEQLPSNVVDNTAARFRFHPSVFMRRSPYIRSVARQYQDQDFITAQGSGMPVRISELSASTFSDWLIIVEGVPQVVSLNHVESAIRRPRDIWNDFWVPLINADSSIGNAPILDMVDQAQTRGPGISQLRLRFLEYARYLGPQGTDQTQTTGV